MEVQPKLNAARFAKIEPGEICIFPFAEGPGFALKIVDPANDGDKFVLPLGPIFSQEGYQPRLLSEPAETTISFGKNFIFRFSVESDAWSVRPPDYQFYCAALVEGRAYLRANGHAFPGRYVQCWVGVADGIIRWGTLPPGIAAFSVKWEILLPQENLPPRLLVGHSGTPLMSTPVT